MDAIRKQLDALMGADRNGDVPVKKEFSDPDVCRYYLCGLCPHDLFNNTKMDIGDCPKLHSAPLKVEYEEARKNKDYGYEQDLEYQLQYYIDECERRIIKNQRRLEETQGPDMDDTANQIKEYYAQAEKLGEEGMVQESLEYIKKAEDLKSRKLHEQQMQTATLYAMIPGLPEGGPTPTQQQKLRVCDICASFLSIFDSDRRLADHFGGKLHIGYLQIRDKLKELKELKRKEGKEKFERERTRYRERSRSDRDYDRERDDHQRKTRHNDRERNHGERNYVRERDRDNVRERDQVRERERDQVRDRDYVRERDRDTSVDQKERTRSERRDRR